MPTLRNGYGTASHRGFFVGLAEKLVQVARARAAKGWPAAEYTRWRSRRNEAVQGTSGSKVAMHRTAAVVLYSDATIESTAGRISSAQPRANG